MFVSQCNNKEVGKLRVRRRDTRIWFLALGVFLAVFLFTFLTHTFKKMDTKVEAASLANFDPGYIISDYQMGNYNSMTEAEIQAFLTRKNPCDNTDYNYYLTLSANRNYTWHFDNGHFICLSEERFGDGEIIGSGDTAAHIIWQAAQDYRINPQVLIVLLQKETGLITDRIPNNGDYRKATGYGCPDTAPCSAQYYGFKNQIRKAASLFRTVLDGGWTNYPLGENYIQYNPNPACGGSVVNIRNLATSSLYRYTPYQPNAGALAAGYGTAYCGAYGNRNFYHYFEDWFGGITLNVDPRSEIEKYYAKIGGEDSELGAPIAEEVCGLTNNGCYRAYQNGYIYWSKNSGVYSIKKGAMFDAWFNQGTEWGPIGYPTGDEKSDDKGIYQKFENGTIYIRNNIVYIIRNFADDLWKTNGLGKNTDLGTCILTNNGCSQTFENGHVYYTKNIKAHVVAGAFYERYEKRNKEAGVLGYPTNNAEEIDGGLRQKFEKGYIYWSEKTGAWDVSGGILLKWQEYKSSDGFLGYPTSCEQKNEKGMIFQSFENGNIYWDISTGAWVIRDFAIEKWEALGGIKSKLRKIASTGYCGLIRGGCYQAFETGNIYWSETTGAFDVSGGIYQTYLKYGTEWGVLGYPTSSELKNEKGLIYQTFENGTIYWDTSTGAWMVCSFATKKWEDLGATKSKLGKALNNGYCGLIRGGCYQAFETGNIYWSETTGAFDVSGGIYQTYLKYGTEWGSLGYPTSSEQKDENNQIYQTFENGTVYWDVNTGARVVLK